MGVVIGAVLATGVLSILIGIAAWQLGLRRKAIVFGLVALTFILAVGPIASWLWSSTVRRGTDVPLVQYSALGPRLPSCVDRVTFYSDYANTFATFRISETDFVNWVKQSGWSVKSIGATPETVDISELEVNRTVADGLLVEETFDPTGAGVHIIFDRGTKECFFHYAGY